MALLPRKAHKILSDRVSFRERDFVPASALTRIDDSVDASTDAPLPVLGLSCAYRISSRWMLETRGQVFRVELDDVEGRIDNLSAVIAYAPLRTTSVFVGYNYYVLDVI